MLSSTNEQSRPRGDQLIANKNYPYTHGIVGITMPLICERHTFQPHIWTIHGSARNPIPAYTLDSLSRSSATITLFVVCCLLDGKPQNFESQWSPNCQIGASSGKEI